MKANKEIEMKLLVSRSDLFKLLQLEKLAACIRPGSRYARKLRSTYYDTKDMEFKRRGLAYRVRDKGDGAFECTVKASLKNQGGLSQRMELNLPLAGDKPCLDGFKQMGLGFELSEIAPEGIEPLFTVSVERTTYILDLDGAVVELAIDAGEIAAGNKQEKIDEIELELLEGDIGELFKLAAYISAQVPIFAEKRSKYSRGLTLIGVEAGPSFPAFPEAVGEGIDAALELAQYYGDRLLSAQNDLRAGLTNKETYARLGDSLCNFEALASRLASPAEDMLPWRKLLESALKETEAISRAISSKEMHAKEIICGWAQEGKFSAVYYGLMSFLHAAKSDDLD